MSHGIQYIWKPMRIAFHAIGDWAPGQVRLTRTLTSSRRIVPEVERLIDETWARAASRPGVHLFDGPMCRLESFVASPGALTLTVSATSYKPFVGTNLHNPHLAQVHGRDVFANPIGVSTLVETTDGMLMLGHRNASVAYYPNRIHPFAGTIDPADGDDPFAAAQRELAEELRLTPGEAGTLRCVGLVEDAALLQPELIFVGRSQVMRDELVRRVDGTEHEATHVMPATEAAIAAAIGHPLMTPVAVASLLLWGRLRWGVDWFGRHRVTAGKPAG